MYCTFSWSQYNSRTCFIKKELSLRENPQGSHFSQKRFRFQSTPMSSTLFFNLDLVSRISEFGPVLLWSGLFFKGKLPVQSLVPSLSLNNLTPLTIIFSTTCFSPFNKIIPLRVDKKTAPLRIIKNRTPPDWQN